MENRNSAAAALPSIDNENGEDVTTWALPEGATARLGRGSVRDMAFSPDGQHLAVGTSIGLWLYDLPTLSPIALWETDRGFSDRVTFSPDGRWIAAHPREALTVWNIQNESCIAEMEFRDQQDCRDLSKPVFSQDGERLVVFSGHQQRMKKIQVWCPHTGTQLSKTEIPSTYDVYPTCFSQDLSLLAGTSYDINNSPKAEFIAVWDVETAEQIARLEWSERWGRLCFSPCGRFLAAGGSEGKIQVWNVETGNLEETYTEDEDAQMHPYYPPEGGLIAAVVFPSQSKIEIHHLEKGEKLDEFEHRGNRSTVHFSHSGTQLALANSSEIQIWTKGNNADAHTPSTLHGHISTVDTLAFSAEKTLASASWGDNVLLWDITSKHPYRPQGEKLPASSHNVYRFPSGELISINVYGDNLNVLEVGKREPLAELAGPEGGLGRAKAFAPTGNRIASADRNGNIHIWERTSTLNDIKESENWKKHATVINDEEFTYGLVHSPTGLAFSPDGKQLASISRSRDWKACLWDVDSGEQIFELSLTPLPSRAGKYGKVYIYAYRGYDTGIAFSPRGDIIAGGKWGEIVLWDSTEGKVLMTLPQPEESQRPITLCFSPCGEYLASGAWWQGGLQKVPIRLWEIATGKNIVTFWGHTTDVQCFAFSQDGTLLVSGGHDGAIYLWDLKPYL